MTAPVEDDDIVIPLRLQPVVARPQGWRGQSSTLVVAGLAGFIAVAIVLGSAFDHGQPPSSPAAAVFATPSASTPRMALTRPNPTLRSQLPPLPARQVIGGRIPDERRLVYAAGLQMLDLATGELSGPPRPYEDLLLPLDGDQLVCACADRQRPVGDDAGFTVVLRFQRLTADGTILMEHAIRTFEDVVDVAEVSPGYATAATLSADQRTLYVLTAIRRPPTWTVELDRVDVTTGTVIDTTLVDELPSSPRDPSAPGPAPSGSVPDPGLRGALPDGLFIWANWLTEAPDGAYLAATITFAEVRDETWNSGSRDWLIPLSIGQAGPVVSLRPEAQLPANSWCTGPPELVAALLVQVCGTPADPLRGLYVRRVSMAGEPLAALPVGPESLQANPAVAFDRARSAVLAWDPVAHRLTRVDLADGSLTVLDVAADLLPATSPSHRGGYFGADPGLVLSPDGTRLYALGFALGPSDSGTPTGVWAFDAETLGLVDHWPPLAMLTSIAVSADGQFVYAAGANGFDVEGYQNAWPTSVTVYDAATGEVQIVYGAVSQDQWLSFRPLP